MTPSAARFALSKGHACSDPITASRRIPQIVRVPTPFRQSRVDESPVA